MPARQIPEPGASQLVFLNTLRDVSTYLGMRQKTFQNTWAQASPQRWLRTPDKTNCATFPARYSTNLIN
jgi:hypothetical protein